MTSTGFDRRLAALGKPSVLIPLATSAGNEQEHNALHLQQADAAVALVKKVVTPEGLRASVGPILASPSNVDTRPSRPAPWDVRMPRTV